jgi:hypothetical protein
LPPKPRNTHPALYRNPTVYSITRAVKDKEMG